MSSIKTSSFRRSQDDHFLPEAETNPAAQKRLRGQLEQIDYTAFASNGAVVAQLVGSLDSGRFQRLAIAAAHARARWVAEALAISERSHDVTIEQTAHLGALRQTFEELTEAYDAARRMIERGYLSFTTNGPS
jgi:long-subunit acyl-CoA synthetase (AMP-forming)